MSFFTSLNLVIFGLKHIYTGCLVNLTPPTILPRSFLNVSVVSVKFFMHDIGCKPQMQFCHIIQRLNLNSFSTKAYRHWVSYERNSSYNFTWIFF